MTRLITLLLLGLACWTATVSSKTIGLKPASDESLEREDEEILISPESATEAMLATQLLEEDLLKSLKEEMMQDSAILSSALESSFPEPEQEPEADSDPQKKLQHHRSKRTIGFMFRLGNCILTFMSNPSCWSRLTKNQIYRAQQREKQQMEQEQQRLLQQQEQLLLMAAANGTDISNVTLIVTPPPNKYTPTTRRPSFFSTIRNAMRAFFPRLFGGSGDDSSYPPRMFQLNNN